MRRRQFLSATAGVAALSVAGVAGGARHESPSTTAQTAFEPLSRLRLDGAKEAVVSDDGETVFVATTRGFATVDISDPGEPTVLAERRNLLSDRENGPLEAIQDVKVDGDRLLVVGPANPIREAINAALLYDVSDPADPRQVAVHETEFFIHNADLADGVAYLPANGRRINLLVTVDVESDPPERLGTWSIMDENDAWETVPPGLRTLHDVYVQDGRAYLAHWDAGTWIVDVSDPTKPSLVTRVRGRSAEELSQYTSSSVEGLEPPGNDHYAAVDDDATVLAIGAEAWDRGNDGTGGPGGIELFDISTPTESQSLSFVEPPPTADASFSGAWTTSHNFEFAGDRLYTSWYQGGVRVFDVSDPAAPNELAAWRDSETTSFWTAQHAGDVVVASSRTNPSDPVENGSLYVFPDPETDLFDRTRTPLTPTETNPNKATTHSSGTTPATTQRGTGTVFPTPTPTGSTPDPSGSTTRGTGPGFGVLAALAGLGLGAWHRLR